MIFRDRLDACFRVTLHGGPDFSISFDDARSAKNPTNVHVTAAMGANAVIASNVVPCFLIFILNSVAGDLRAVRSVLMSSTPSEAEALAAAKVLCEDGVVMLKCAALEALAPPAENGKAMLANMLERARRAGVDSEQRFSFAEICHRSPRRYDLHLGNGLSTSAFSTLVNELVMPVLISCATTPADGAVRILRDGLVTSLPGASAQPFHADGREQGLFNAFLPLVPINGQGTEFWLSSHADVAAAGRLKHEQTGQYIGEEILDDSEIAPLISGPTMERAEGLVLFDYRIIHRGRAHGANSPVRPVFYRVFALGSASEDVHNWPKRSLSDAEMAL